MAMALVAGAAPVAHRRTHGRGSRAVQEQNANRKLTRRGGMIGAASGYDRKGAAIFEEAFMGGEHSKPQGPDLAQGVPLADIPDGGMVGGHVGDEAVLLARGGRELFAIGATCSHYSGPLAEGLVVGDTVHCPWHHARFSLRTGEAIAAPALGPVPCWRVEQRDGKAFVRD